MHASPGGPGTGPAIAVDEVLAFIDVVAGLDDADEVLGVFRAQAGRHGFSTVVVGALPDPARRAFPSFFVSTWSAEFADEYREQDLIRSDPSVEAARSRILPVLWSDLAAERRARGGDMRPFRLTRAWGFPEGIAIPMHGPNGYSGLVTIAGETADLSSYARLALHLMAIHAHNRLRELLAPSPPEAKGALPELSAGEIECIRWLVAGKSDWEIGEILAIAESTAHWRIERAKRKFGVKTRAQLAALAVWHGIVVP